MLKEENAITTSFVHLDLVVETFNGFAVIMVDEVSWSKISRAS